MFRPADPLLFLVTRDRGGNKPTDGLCRSFPPLPCRVTTRAPVGEFTTPSSLTLVSADLAFVCAELEYPTWCAISGKRV
jgi:hypothetical protein